MKYEFSIAVKDESKKHRKKEGDIISIRSYPRNCGRKVIDECLIVIVECDNENQVELKTKLRQPLWKHGLVEGIDFREIVHRDDNLDSIVYPAEDYVWEIQAEQPMKWPKKVAKRRYKIPLALLGNIDLTKVKDKNYIYQPFKKASQLVKKFDGKEHRHYLKVEDVDCAATGIGAEQEVVFQWSALDNLVMDKYTDSYIKP